jgi:hypothetical protein
MSNSYITLIAFGAVLFIGFVMFTLALVKANPTAEADLRKINSKEVPESEGDVGLSRPGL